MHGTFKKPTRVRRRICHIVRSASPTGEHSGWERVSPERYALKLECSTGQRHKVGGLVEDFQGNGLHGRAIYAWSQIAEWDSHLKLLYHNFLEEWIAERSREEAERKQQEEAERPKETASPSIQPEHELTLEPA
jgi:hypothetical protein